MKKRSVKQKCIDALRLIGQDVKKNRWAIVAVVAYLGIMKFFLRKICPMVLVTGYPCPGCGLTRAGVALLTGHFELAFRMHPFIYVMILLAIVFAVNRYWLGKSWRFYKICVVVCLCAMVVFYIYRMMVYFPGEPPMEYYHGNLFERLSFFVHLWVK